jgi:hypothetical protein
MGFPIPTGTIVQHNLIGTDNSGATGLGNGVNGISLAQTSGLALIRDNVISGNDGIGVSAFLSDTGSVRVEGNLIGTNANGTDEIENAGDGILMNGNLASSVIGGETESERNIISGNGGNGIAIGGAGLQVLNNYIGTKRTGNAELGNGKDGVTSQVPHRSGNAEQEISSQEMSKQELMCTPAGR